MKHLMKLFALLMFAALISSCNQQMASKEESSKNVIPLMDKVLTEKAQSELSPDDIIQQFKEGNERYQKNQLTARDLPAQVSKTTHGQYPEAIILSCIDSRVPVETVFDKGVGDVFVTRVAGNFVSEDILGGMEYACKVSGSKVILVMGHEHCGAVKAAIDDVKLGNITPMLAKIRPVVESIEYEGDKTSKNEEFVQKVCENNVSYTIQQIRDKSPILKELEDKGAIKIVGAVYDLDNGKVNFLD